MNLSVLALDPSSISRPVSQTQIHQFLTAAIGSGALKPGDRIPAERELADAFGVSRGTIREALGELVRKGLVVRLIGKGSFVAMPVAEGMRSRPTTGNLGYVLDSRQDTATNDMAFTMAMERAVKERQMHLLVCAVDESDPSDLSSFDSLAMKVDGLLIREAHSATIADRASRLGLPVVLLLPTTEIGRYDTVTVDNHSIGWSACQYLYDLGHRRVGHVRGIVGTLAGDRRSAGFFANAKSHRLGLADTHESGGVSWTPEAGYEAMRELLRTHPDLTGVFVSSDGLAYGAMRAIRELGLRVPDQLSVLTCDSIPPTRGDDWELSSFSLHETVLIDESVSRLVSRSAQPDSPRVRFELTPSFVDRESCSAVRSSM